MLHTHLARQLRATLVQGISSLNYLSLSKYLYIKQMIPKRAVSVMRKIAQQDMGNSAYVGCHQCSEVMSHRYHDNGFLILSGISLGQF